MTQPIPAVFATIALASLALGACSSATEPAAAPNLSLLLGAIEVTTAETPSVNVAENDVVFRGAIETPCPSYQILADAQRSAEGYVITLRGNRASGACPDAVANVPYIGTLWDLPSGTARVIVRHVIEDANWPADTVIDTRVVVR
jgi:hypothetical protein